MIHLALVAAFKLPSIGSDIAADWTQQRATLAAQAEAQTQGLTR